MKPRKLVFCLSLVCGCGGAATQAKPVSVAGGSVVALGTLDGVTLTTNDLSSDVNDRLRDVQNESEQRKFHLLWAGFEEAVANRLLAQEAAKRGVSVDKLRADEIVAKAPVPSDEEVRTMYDANQAEIGVPFEVAAPHIKREIQRERSEEQERAFTERLREKAQIMYGLPAPQLPRFNVDAGNSPILGPKDAKVTLIEFSDFQCPYCARARGMLKRLHELYPKDLRVVFRDFPLDQHPDARHAAEAAQCADEQGKFWPFHDLLFDNPSSLETNDLVHYAEQVQLDTAAFKSCLASERPKQKVAAAEADGRRVGVEGTPAIFINGIKLIGLLPMPLMQALIDRELRNL